MKLFSLAKSWIHAKTAPKPSVKRSAAPQRVNKASMIREWRARVAAESGQNPVSLPRKPAMAQASLWHGVPNYGSTPTLVVNHGPGGGWLNPEAARWCELTARGLRHPDQAPVVRHDLRPKMARFSTSTLSAGSSQSSQSRIPAKLQAQWESYQRRSFEED